LGFALLVNGTFEEAVYLFVSCPRILETILRTEKMSAGSPLRVVEVLLAFRAFQTGLDKGFTPTARRIGRHEKKFEFDYSNYDSAFRFHSNW
jgi:hypothetical protein